MKRLAIIGAGISGLAAAWGLRTSSITVTVFEKSRGYSGRAATRRRHGFHYDHGANYFRTDAEQVRQIVLHDLPTDALVDIGKPVWTFDQDGTLQPGDPAANEAPKWTYREGISTLGKLLAAGADAEVHTQVQVHHVERENNRWTVVDAKGGRYSPFDAVLLTPPAPQTHALLQASTLDAAVQGQLLDGLAEARYQSQFSIMLAFDHVPRPGPFYGLVNTDGAHDVAWLSFEEDKPGHVPEGQSLLVVQMAPGWTEAHYEAAHEDLIGAVRRKAGALLGTELARPIWSDRQRWRYALPTAPANTEQLESAATQNLFFAGDALVGRGRVPRALETGVRAAQKIQTALRG